MVSIDEQISCIYHIKNPPKSVLVENDFMQIIGRKSRILQFYSIYNFLNQNSINYIYDRVLILSTYSMLKFLIFIIAIQIKLFASSNNYKNRITFDKTFNLYNSNKHM